MTDAKDNHNGDPVRLTCMKPECGRPFAYLAGDVLHIESKHGSETHINAISVLALVRLVWGPDAVVLAPVKVTANATAN